VRPCNVVSVWTVRAHGEATGAPGEAPALDSPAPDLPAYLLLLILAIMVAVGGQGGYAGPSLALLVVLLAAAAVASVAGAPRGGMARTRATWRPRAWRTADPRSDARSLRARVVLPEVAAVLAALGLLAGWALARAMMGAAPLDGLGPATLSAGVATTLVLSHRARSSYRAVLLTGVVGVGAVAALSGWVGVVWRIEPLALPNSGVWRAAGTVTYENALAGLLVPLALLTLAHLAVGTSEHADGATRPATAVQDGRVRGATAVAAYLLLLGAGATLSRGGGLALAIGLGVLAVLAGPRRLARAAWGPVVGAVVALTGLAPTMIASAPARPVIAVTALIAGGAIAWWSARGRQAVLLIGPLVVVAAVLAMAVPEVRAAAGQRMTVASPHRASQHAAAAAVIAEHPLVGVGPGRGAVSWSDDDGNVLVARYVHDEYVQVAVELGLVGVIALMGAVVLAARALGRGRATVPAAAWTGVVAALTAFAVHSATDFLWHFPAIPIVGALMAGAATRYPSSALE
jgi:O-antigen ligase